LHKIFYAETTERVKSCGRHSRKCNVIIKMTFKVMGLKIWRELIRLMTKRNDQFLSTRQLSLYKIAEEFHM